LYGVSADNCACSRLNVGREAPTNPAGRIGTPDDVASAVLFAMTNTFMTGMTLRVDGSEPLT
jgi:NAD(P)-dependent dehydrogenase (short-subunit alcohol dehydrogenase family)